MNVQEESTTKEMEETILGAAYYEEGTADAGATSIASSTGQILLNNQDLTKSVLESLDNNSDGIIDFNDANYNNLTIWQDTNENGIQDDGEVKSLSSAGMLKIYTEDSDLFTIGDSQGLTTDVEASRNTLDYTYWRGQTKLSAGGYVFNSADPLPTTDETKIVGTTGNDAFGTNYFNAAITPGQIMTLLGGDGNDLLVGNNATNSNESLYGGTGGDTLIGNIGEDFLNGEAGDDELQGGDDNDTLFAEDGNDTLWGGAGNDLLSGDAGNDYLSDASGDDTFMAGSGNDTIWGRSGNDYINSGTEDDQIVAGTGNDTVYGDDGADLIYGSYSNDTFAEGETDHDSLYGGAGNDTIVGLTGDDYIDGGADSDYMEGGTGNDTYVVNSRNDKIVEKQNEGNDKVFSSVSYILNSDIEELKLLGTSDINATGNKLNNTVIGNIGNNVISGSVGSDTLIGQDGNDIYKVDNTNDVITENLNEGTDTAIATTSYELGANVENIILDSYANAEAGVVDGQNVLVYGRPKRYELDYMQGDKNTDYLGSCGLVSIANMLTQSGVEVTEEEVVDYAVANNLTVTAQESALATERGGTTRTEQLAILAGFGLDSTSFIGYSPELIAQKVKDGHSVLLAVNAGHLWDYPEGIGTGVVNHAITVTGVVYDSTNTTIQGFYICDSGLQELNDMSRYVDIDRFALAANVTSSYFIATDNSVRGWELDVNATGNTLNNEITGNEGNNILNGQAGNDIYTLNENWGSDTIVDTTGNDEVKITDTSISQNDLSGTKDGNDLVLTQNETSNQVRIENFFVWGDDNKVEEIVLADNSRHNLAGFAVNIEEGTDVSTILKGISSHDSITGGSGSDQLYGYGGEDTLVGGAGNDYLVDGGLEKDTLVGGIGNDVYSIFGDDIIVENSGEGYDMIYTYNTNYTMAENTEYIASTNTNDISFTGNSQDNILKGNIGNDTLLGLDGKDILEGKEGNDSLAGGTGNDQYILRNNWGNDTISDTSGSETIIITDASITKDNIVSTNSGNDLVLSQQGSSNQVTIKDYFASTDNRIEYIRFANRETVATHSLVNLTFSGTNGNDSIEGQISNDSITGGEGNDSLYGHSGADTLVGGAGNDYLVDSTDEEDTLIGGTGDDVYSIRGNDSIVENADEGHDSIYTYNTTYTMADHTEYLAATNSSDNNFTGNAQNNTIKGHSGNDTLSGLDGNDTLEGKNGNDSLNGGVGNDAYLIKAGWGNDTISDSSGTDFISFADLSIVEEDISVNKSGDDVIILQENTTNQITIKNYFTSENNKIETMKFGNGTIRTIDELVENNISGTSNDDNLSGDSYSDSMEGGEGNDTLKGLQGEDTLLGEAGNDYLIGGGYESDTLIGGIGNDVYSVSGNDVITELADEGYDSIYTFNKTYTMADHTEYLSATNSSGVDFTGNNQSNTIKGNSGNDTISGADGNDTIDALGGNDTISGGTGNDTYILRADWGNDTISESSGTDSIKIFDIAITKDDIELTQSGNDLLVSQKETSNLVTIKDYFLSESHEIESIYFADGYSSPIAALLDNTTTGTSNDDNLVGNTYADYMEGGEGNDTIQGLQGEDTIYGEAGNDYLIGGGYESDTLIGGIGNDVYSVSGNDVITELADEGYDSIYTYNKSYTMADHTEYLAATNSSGVTFTGNNQNNVIKGHSGNDIIDGGAGNDLLEGKTGNDTYIINDGLQSDTIYDTGGVDTISISEGKNYSAGEVAVYFSGSTLVIGTDWQTSEYQNIVTIKNYNSTSTPDTNIEYAEFNFNDGTKGLTTAEINTIITEISAYAGTAPNGINDMHAVLTDATNTNVADQLATLIPSN